MSGIYDPELGEAMGQEESHHLTCQIKAVKEQVTLTKRLGEDIKGEDVTIFLVPEMNTQFTRFLLAHNPDDYELAQSIQLVSIIPYPINQPCRIAYMTSNEKCSDRHHFRVMTVDVEDAIKARMKDGDKLTIEVVPFSEEEKYSV